MNTLNRMLKHILCFMVVSLLITQAQAGIFVNGNKAGIKHNPNLRMLFAGRAENATIYPFAHRKDLFLIEIHDVTQIVAFSETPGRFANKIKMSSLAEDLWKKQTLNSCIIGQFNVSNQFTSYVFELSNPSYNNKTNTLSVHAQSFGGKQLSAFASKKPTTIKNLSFFIDPIMLGAHWNNF